MVPWINLSSARFQPRALVKIWWPSFSRDGNHPLSLSGSRWPKKCQLLTRYIQSAFYVALRKGCDVEGPASQCDKIRHHTWMYTYTLPNTFNSDISYIYIFRYKLWHIDACRHDTYYLYTTMCSRLYIPTSKEQSLTANDPPHPLCLPPMPPLRSSMMLVNSGIISYHQMDIARILVIYTPAHPKNGNHLYYQIYMYIYIINYSILKNAPNISIDYWSFTIRYKNIKWNTPWSERPHPEGT